MNMSILQGAAIAVLAVGALTASRASATSLAVSACSPGNVYYVSTTGNDSNPGTLASPWRTIRKAANSALKPCDTVYVRGGVYYDIGIYFKPSGVAGKPISYLAYPGELPIVDSSQGASSSGITVTNWTETFGIQGAYLQVAGFELRYGKLGVAVNGTHNVVANLNVHDMQQHGIWAKGDYNLVEFNRINHASLAHKANLSQTGWAFGVGAGYNPISGVTHFTVLRGNVVSNSWGEGVNTMGVDNAIIDGNTSYDNWAQNIYANNATNVIVRNNIAYNTPNNEVGRRAPGITLADELSTIPVSAHVAVINNALYNADLYAFAWTQVAGTGLNGDLISDNSLVDGALRTGGSANNVVNVGSVLQNNIVYRNDGGSVAAVPSAAGLTFRNNSWSVKPPITANGKGDLIGNPMLSLSGSTLPGQLSLSYFTVSSSSPVIAAGAPVSMTTTNWQISTTSGVTPNIGEVAGNPAIVYQ